MKVIQMFSCVMHLMQYEPILFR